VNGERQVPFFCPYCGEETLRPAGLQAGHWQCDSCARSFQLRFTAVLRPSAAEPGRRPAGPADLPPSAAEPGRRRAGPADLRPSDLPSGAAS